MEMSNFSNRAFSEQLTRKNLGAEKLQLNSNGGGAQCSVMRVSAAKIF